MDHATGATIITTPRRAHEGTPVMVAWIGRPGGVYLDEVDPDDPWRRTRRTLLYTNAYSVDRAAQIGGHARLARRLQPLPGVNSRRIGPDEVPTIRRHYLFGLPHGPGLASAPGVPLSGDGMVAEMDQADAAALFRSPFAREFLYLDLERQEHARRVNENTGITQELRHHHLGRTGDPAGEPGPPGMVLAGLLTTRVGPAGRPGVRPLTGQDLARQFPRRR